VARASVQHCHPGQKLVDQVGQDVVVIHLAAVERLEAVAVVVGVQLGAVQPAGRALPGQEAVTLGAVVVLDLPLLQAG
jgi:hypothetical protein